MGNKITRVVVGGSQGDINFESLTNSLFFIQSCFCYLGISSIKKNSVLFHRKIHLFPMEVTNQVYLLVAASKTSIVLRKYLLDIVFQGKRKIMSPCRKLTLT